MVITFSNISKYMKLLVIFILIVASVSVFVVRNRTNDDITENEDKNRYFVIKPFDILHILTICFSLYLKLVW